MRQKTPQIKIIKGLKRTMNKQTRNVKYLHTAALFPGKLKKASGPYF